MLILYDVLLQIENEYGHQAKLLGSAGYQYATWAANMALEMNTGVPWVMCKEEDAPDPVVYITPYETWLHKRKESDCFYLQRKVLL